MSNSIISSERRSNRYGRPATYDERVEGFISAAQAAFARANGADLFSPRDIATAAVPIFNTDADGKRHLRHEDDIVADIKALDEKITSEAIAAGVYEIWLGKIYWRNALRAGMTIPNPIEEVK